VYRTLLPFRYLVKTPLDSIAIDTLNTIAIQNPQVAGPAVYAARAVLWKEANMQFVDNEKDHEPGLTAKIKHLNCLPALPANLTVQLMDAANHIYNTPVQLLDDETVYIAPEEIALFDQSKQYTFIINYLYSAPTILINEWIYGNNNIINLCVLGKQLILKIIKKRKLKIMWLVFILILQTTN